MSIQPAPGTAAEPPRARTGWLGRFLRWLLALILLGALGAAAYGGYWYAEQRFQATRATLAQETETYRRDVERRVTELAERVGKAEQAAASAGLLVPGAGGQVPLDQRLNEINALRETLGRNQANLEQKLQDLQKNVTETLARQQREADATLAARLARQNRLLQAQGHATRALTDLAAGNWGLAREDLRPIPALLQSPDASEAGAQADQIAAVVRLVDEARVALSGEASTAPELVRMIWARISELVAATQPPGR